MMLCIACEWRLKPNEERDAEEVVVERYDRIQALYLTTGDRSALQQMNTRYPEQTRMLIEDVLNIGPVNDPAINIKFLHFYQDSVLQAIIADVERKYADLSDLDEELQSAFKELRTVVPDFQVPVIYAQIGALTQSIIVGDSMLGICLDKYLGADYPLYAQFYPEDQRKQMTRQMIVPDCIGFYILSQFPIQESDTTADSRHRHMGKIQWVVNKVTHKRTFNNEYVKAADTYMRSHRHTTVRQLLESR